MFTFDPNIPIYIQIMNYVKKEIVTGRLQQGEKLPSVRELAGELQTNPNTVQRALQELEREGIAETRRGTGRYVTQERGKIMEMKQVILAFVFFWLISSAILWLSDLTMSIGPSYTLIAAMELEFSILGNLFDLFTFSAFLFGTAYLIDRRIEG